MGSSVGQEYVIDDGLTDLERKQRSIAPSFLTGSAKSQADATTIRDDVEADDFFGLDLTASNFFLLLFLVFLDWLDAFQETSHYKIKKYIMLASFGELLDSKMDIFGYRFLNEFKMI